MNRHVSRAACYPPGRITECGRLEARHNRVTSDINVHSTTAVGPEALIDIGLTESEEAIDRRLGSRNVPMYIPGKAAHCEQCATCKQQYEGNPSISLPSSCRKACKKCPGTVVLGAESALSIQVDGITAMEYVRDGAASGSGRALQGSDQGNGVTVVQYATTVFEGTCVRMNQRLDSCWGCLHL
jgi:hypothetical protein